MMFLTWEEVMRRTTLSRSQLYRMIDAGKFPHPVRIGDNSTRFQEHQIEAWMQAQVEESERTGWRTRPRGRQSRQDDPGDAEGQRPK
jgi:prophage regulatory protein